MNISDATKILAAAKIADDCVIMEGLHGIGKSEIVAEFGINEGIHVEPLFLSNQEVGDLIGNPKTIEKDGVTITTWSIPAWLHRMNKKAEQGIESVLFLDELNRAPLDVRQSALQLILERKIHEHSLPVVNGNRTMVVAAINPADEYQVDELDPALIDRFLYINVEPDPKSWLVWARNKNINSVIRDFIAEHPDRLHWTPKDGGIGATPRSWAKLGKYIDNTKKIDEDILFQIMKGKIGTEIGSQFYTYYKNYVDVVKMEDIEKLVAKNKDSVTKIEDLAEMITELMVKTEAIQKTEMAHQLSEKYMVKKDILPFLVYLYSLEVEICVAFLKGYRNDEPEKYKKLAKIDDELNNKELFKRIVIAADKK